MPPTSTQAAIYGDASVTPTPEVVSPVRGEDRAYDAARDALVQQTGVALSDIQRIEVPSQEWSDACLGLAGQGEMCATVITPGYRVVMAANGAQYVARTNADGSAVRFENDRPVTSGSDIVAWDAAVAMVLDGRVTQVFQTHALTVTLYLDDGSKVDHGGACHRRHLRRRRTLWRPLQ